MNRRRLPRNLLLFAAIALLAACAGTPKKGDAPETGKSAGTDGSHAGQPQQRKRSPYAPAQEDPSKRGDYTSGGLYAPHVADSAPDGDIDVDAIPEPDVVDEPRSRYGNRSPYTVLGKRYRVLDSAKGYDETGIASYYGNKFHGRRTSNLEVYDMYAFTAAHRTLPLPSFARVTNLDNGKSVVVRVNDRGPFHDGRLIDLSYAAAVKLGIHPRGTGRVEVVGLSPGENARHDYDAVAARDAALPAGSRALQLPPGVRIATGKPALAAEASRPAPPSAMDTLVDGVIASAGAAERPATAAATAAPAGAVAARPGSDRDWRFDMRQDGKAMTADQFDAWMKARRARVATGKAGKPDPYGSAAPRALAAADRTSPAPAAETVAAAHEADQAPPPQAVVPTVSTGPGVVLQVAAFGARANAERALSMLRGAGVQGARMIDAVSNGKPVWRVRVGPVENTRVAELSARVADLGFGQPQVVRE